MSIFSQRPALRWAVPGVAAVTFVGGGALVSTISANADAGLPPRTAAQLLADVQQARLDGLSGTVVQRSDLGIPSIPGTGGQGSSDLTSLVSGTHTLRVWYAGPDKARLALLGELGESDVIQNGTDLWMWSSRDNTATHRTLSKDLGSAHKAPDATNLPKTPQQAADQALAAINPTTSVTTSGTATVAGRSAYELLLAPRDSRSLVSQVRIAVDGVKHVPLRVQVYARGAAAPAFEVGFTAVDFARPDAAQFAFNPPPGAKVKEASPTGTEKMGQAQPDPDKGKPAARPADRPKVVGTGWTTVVVAKLPAGTVDKAGGQAAQLGALLNALPKVSGTWGSGRLLAGKLFSVVLTDDGRVAAGAVQPQVLYAALAAK